MKKTIALIFIIVAGALYGQSDSLDIPEYEILIESIQKAMSELESYRMDGEAIIKESENTSQELFTLEFEGKMKSNGDKTLLMALDLDIGDIAASVSFEEIVVAGVNYMKNPLSEDWEIGDEGGSFLGEFFDTFWFKDSELGDESIEMTLLDEIPMYRISGNPIEEEYDTYNLWVDVDKKRIRQIQIEGYMPADDFEGISPPGLDTLFMNVTLRVSGFNENYYIVAPVKAAPTMAYLVPLRIGYVNDYAGVIEAAQEDEISRLLRTVRLATADEVVVASVQSLGEATSIEELASTMAYQWELGVDGEGNWVLVIISMAERKVRVEVGPGVKMIFTDDTVESVVDIMLSHFSDDDYGSGFLAGSELLSDMLLENYYGYLIGS